MFDKIFLQLGAGLASIVTMLLLSLITCFFIMYLWNWLMPALFGLKIITLWQALGLAVLFGLLFRK